MDTSSNRDARRVFLKNVGVKLLVAAPLAMTFGAAEATKARKDDFFFQEQPKNGKRCADCRMFIRDSSNPVVGTCTVVDGSISADGWCMAFVPR